jgi:hypothetical protein
MYVRVYSFVLCMHDKQTYTQLFDDFILVNGERLDFPLVEKPYDGDNHNIHVLYGKGKGGRKLFRKITDRSSEFYPDLHRYVYICVCVCVDVYA